jgi:L-seryl-tRNA(Ser) seleniumtransferase
MSAQNPSQNPFRLLPSVEQLLQARGPAEPGPARDLAARLAGELLGRVRERLRSGELDAAGLAAWLAGKGPALELDALLAKERGQGLRRVINATGVVLNTGLGRAPLHPEAAAAMAEAARSYCTVEVDRWSGQRNRRDDRTSELLRRLLGVEAGLAVNNCAAAVLLTLQTFAGGRACVLSRGELVEIGGSFRMPDVMQRAGVQLVEVGTTNRTRLADYAAALSPAVGLLLKVHTSNYRVVGFVEEASAAELARLAAEAGLPSAYDLGSGLIDPPGARPFDFLGDEPPLRAALQSGMDVVLFSGDKLLGGPQAGLIVGKKSAIEALRKNPLYRALRLDKVILAGLERTLELLLEGRGDELPTRRLLTRPLAELEASARRLAEALSRLPGLAAEARPGKSQPGSGSAPDVFLDTVCVVVERRGQGAEALARALRAGEPPVFGRIQEGRLWLDPRTLLPGEEQQLIAAFEALLRSL